jgi:hypothetical protein
MLLLISTFQVAYATFVILLVTAVVTATVEVTR